MSVYDLATYQDIGAKRRWRWPLRGRGQEVMDQLSRRYYLHPLMSDKFFELFGKLVPASGQADTVQGELVRSIGRMADEYATNGFCNWDAGYERLSKFALLHLADGTFGPQTSTGIRSDFEHIQKYGRRENIDGYDLDAAIFRLMEASVGWCQRHPDPIPHNPDPELKR